MTIDETLPVTCHDLLRRPVPAQVATIDCEGGVESSSLWFLWDGRWIRLIDPRVREKCRNLARNPVISISISDDPPEGRLEIRGVLDHIEPDPQGGFFRKVSRHYGANEPPPPRASDRIVYVILPTAISWRRN